MIRIMASFTLFIMLVFLAKQLVFSLRRKNSTNRKSNSTICQWERTGLGIEKEME